MKKYISLFNILLVAVGLGLSACSDSDNENESGNQGNEGGEVVLKNQFAYKDQVKDIQSAVRFDEGSNAAVYLSPTAGVTDIKGMREANDYMKVVLPTGRIGLSTDFSQPGMTVEYSGVKLKSGNGAQGPVRIDIQGEAISISLRAEAGEVMECNYEGNFQHQISENLIAVTLMGGEATSNPLKSAFRTPAKGEKKAVTFAVGSVETDTPNGLSGERYSVLFAAPQAHFDGKYHAFKKADGYQLYLIDNENKSYTEEVTEGRMRITGKTTDKNMHLVFEAILSDGSQVSGDYYGEVQEVNDMDILPATNTYTYMSPYAPEVTEKIIEVLHQYNPDKKEHRFGFKKNEYQEFDDYELAEITVTDEVIGTVNGDLTTTPGWKAECGSTLQIEYIAPDDPNAQYKTPSKGSITVIKTGDNYRFNFTGETIPQYEWSKPEKLTISYEGPVTTVE